MRTAGDAKICCFTIQDVGMSIWVTLQASQENGCNRWTRKDFTTDNFCSYWCKRFQKVYWPWTWVNRVTWKLWLKVPMFENFIWVHATVASSTPNWSLQRVPQALLMHTSNRPSRAFGPSCRRISPVTQLPTGVEWSAFNQNVSYTLSYPLNPCTLTHYICISTVTTWLSSIWFKWWTLAKVDLRAHTVVASVVNWHLIRTGKLKPLIASNST